MLKKTSNLHELTYLHDKPVPLILVNFLSFIANPISFSIFRFNAVRDTIRFAMFANSFFVIFLLFLISWLTIRFVIEVIEEIVEEDGVGQSEDDRPARVTAVVEEKLRGVNKSDAELQLEFEINVCQLLKQKNKFFELLSKMNITFYCKYLSVYANMYWRRN